MSDIGLLLGLFGIAVGLGAIAVLFFNADRALPAYRRINELFSIVLLSMLVGASSLLLGFLLSIETYPDAIAVVSQMAGAAVIIYAVRNAEAR
ncbi:MAG: hypothetical protein HYS81_02810 [Candidatus Aenigmatarchaeota archaeon]|nr:MAG: hypothetical protein HYS81_02810 [Candidatus Aenigmarchaeota archaeon]